MLNRRSTEEQGNFTVKSYLKVAEEQSTKKQFSPPASFTKKMWLISHDRSHVN